MEVSGQLHVPATLHPEETDPGTQCIGGWVAVNYDYLQLVKVKSLYDWRFTANQFVLASSPLRRTIRDLSSQLNP
jgi:hypothetical protein